MENGDYIKNYSLSAKSESIFYLFVLMFKISHYLISAFYIIIKIKIITAIIIYATLIRHPQP